MAGGIECGEGEIRGFDSSLRREGEVLLFKKRRGRRWPLGETCNKSEPGSQGRRQAPKAGLSALGLSPSGRRGGEGPPSCVGERGSGSELLCRRLGPKT